MGPVKLREMQWAMASRPAIAGAELGDGCVVVPHDHGVLLAVVDGLGTGSEAASATRRALEAIQRAASAPLQRICLETHDAAQATRGVVLALAHHHTGTGELTWLGVGGVRGLIRHARPAESQLEGLHTQNGIVGRYLPPLKPLVRSFEPGDLLFMTTDGIRAGFEKGWDSDADPEAIASGILAHHAVPGDDALVLVAVRLRGAA